MKLSKGLLTLGIIAVVVVAILLVKKTSHQVNVNFDPVQERSKGSEKAEVKIIEFIDLECPACAHGAMILKDYVAKYPNRIYLQIKYYPLLNIHQHALQVAYYAECSAKQGKFWPFFEPLMQQQRQWSALVNADSIFDQLASAAGVDINKLKTCLNSTEVATAITAEKTLGRSMGVQSTPTYFINGKMVVGSKSLVEELDKYFPNSSQK